MRRGFGLIGLVFTTILLAIVGVLAYNAGWSEGAATHVADGTAAVAPYYYYGPHFFGAGIFGFLFFLFILFVFFGFLRMAIFGRRMWGGGWGYGRGMGPGGPGKHGWYGGNVPPAIEERLKEWHKQAHGEPPSSSSTPPPPDQRSV